ncbi:MAG: ParB N-terminal domain-containing protein [Oscillospiraceae bacterium]|nr:ParB N-terminal domain-containing protein [Oscillospiraceae bacterium]
MPDKLKAKPRLQNLDDLFLLNDGVNPLEQATSIIGTQPTNKRVITSTPIEQLTPFDGFRFRLHEGERMDDMVASIKANGVLVPIIVRRIGTILEILSGHNRVEATKLAGLSDVPAIILENISDADAMVYVIETNLIQRSFSEMCHSEKAAVIALHHSKMFSQGKRNDIIKQLEMLENPHDSRADETSSQVANKLTSMARVGETYSLSKDTVARYLRVNQLIVRLKEYLDYGTIAFIPAVTISYLHESEQSLLANCIERYGLSVDMKKADMLRKYSAKDRLDDDAIKRILSGALNPKPNRTPTVKVSKDVYSKYFKPNQPAKEVQDIVEKALAMYFEKTG